MLILGISGPLYSGRRTAADYLINNLDITEISFGSLDPGFPFRDGNKNYLIIVNTLQDLQLFKDYTFFYLI